jgi:hypothetical protein
MMRIAHQHKGPASLESAFGRTPSFISPGFVAIPSIGQQPIFRTEELGAGS